MVTQEVQTREVTPVVQREIHRVVETSEPIQQTVAVQTKTEPTEVSQTNEPVIEPVATLVQPEAVTAEPTTAPAPTTVAAQDSKPTERVEKESVPQVAMATNPTPAVKVDHGWLAESLRRRLAELKRYPRAVRLRWCPSSISDEGPRAACFVLNSLALSYSISDARAHN